MMLMLMLMSDAPDADDCSWMMYVIMLMTSSWHWCSWMVLLSNAPEEWGCSWVMIVLLSWCSWVMYVMLLNDNPPEWQSWCSWAMFLSITPYWCSWNYLCSCWIILSGVHVPESEWCSPDAPEWWMFLSIAPYRCSLWYYLFSSCCWCRPSWMMLLSLSDTPNANALDAPEWHIGKEWCSWLLILVRDATEWQWWFASVILLSVLLLMRDSPD